jgi:hypothetical protein
VVQPEPCDGGGAMPRSARGNPARSHLDPGVRKRFLPDFVASNRGRGRRTILASRRRDLALGRIDQTHLPLNSEIGDGSRVVGTDDALSACCRWMIPSTLIQDFAWAAWPARAATRALSLTTVGTSVPCTSTMSWASVQSESAVITIASSIIVFDVSAESGRGPPPLVSKGEGRPLFFHRGVSSGWLSNPCRPCRRPCRLLAVCPTHPWARACRQPSPRW